MTHVVHKLVLDITRDKHDVELPLDAIVIHVAAQHGKLCVWYRWNQDITARVKHRFAIVGTGFPCPSALDGEHIGTAIFAEGALVLHLFRQRTAA